jgi:catechol 2,3-dioxygenase-like lactoylglutathione lyase family enzyme
MPALLAIPSRGAGSCPLKGNNPAMIVSVLATSLNEPMKVSAFPGEIVTFGRILVFLQEQVPTGGSKTTTVNHFALQVPDIRQMLDTVRAAGYPIVTRAELPAAIPVTDDLGDVADQHLYSAFTMGPDNAKVEFIENRLLPAAMAGPIGVHHIHFFTPQVAEMKAWYVKALDAKPGRRGSFECADVPDVNLTFSASADPVIGTRGRVYDHIGFEVKRLDAFCRALEGMGITLDRPYMEVSGMNHANAFLTDPWGTRIELTEGLDGVGRS